MISLDFHKLHELSHPKDPFVQVREGFVLFSGCENLFYFSSVGVRAVEGEVTPWSSEQSAGGILSLLPVICIKTVILS